MNIPQRTMLFVAVTVALACRPKASGAETEGLNIELMEQTCEAWCEAAVVCSVHYAGPEWGDFTTQTECEQVCVDHLTAKTELHESCFDLLVEHRQCGASLSCDEFEAYENYAFNEPVDTLPPCKEEYDVLVSTGCY